MGLASWQHIEDGMKTNFMNLNMAHLYDAADGMKINFMDLDMAH